jgi:hypothetical protein
MTSRSCEFHSCAFDQVVCSLVKSRPKSVENARTTTDFRTRTPSPPPDNIPPRELTPDLSYDQPHWLFSPSISTTIQGKKIPFQIKHTRESADDALAAYEGCVARTVPIDCCNSLPREGEIIVNVIKRNRRKQMSIHPKFLVPLEPVVGSTVVVVTGTYLGMVAVVKEQLDRYYIVTFMVDQSREHRFEDKDLATLEDLT